MWQYFKLVMWANFWLLLWFIIFPFRKGRHNCLTYALDRWDNDSGYLVVRWCRSNKITWIKWPHFLFLDEKYQRFLHHAVPLDENDRYPIGDKRIVPQPWFEPRVKVGDRESGKIVEN